MSDLVYQMRDLIELSKEADAILGSEADEETVFDLVFNRIKILVGVTGIKVEWTDPDEGYLDDATAYVLALRSKADQLRKVVLEMEGGVS